MNTATLKRKNIDLTENTIRKLSILAAAQGRSLKGYIEDILTDKANSVEISVVENPSPSGDPFFADPNNVEYIKTAISESKKSTGRVFTLEEINKALGL